MFAKAMCIPCAGTEGDTECACQGFGWEAVVLHPKWTWEVFEDLLLARLSNMNSTETKNLSMACDLFQLHGNEWYVGTRNKSPEADMHRVVKILVPEGDRDDV